MQDKRALPLLTELAKGSTPELRALALLGLAPRQTRPRPELRPSGVVAGCRQRGSRSRSLALAEMNAVQHADVLLAMGGARTRSREASLLALSSWIRQGAGRDRRITLRSQPAVSQAAFARVGGALTREGKRAGILCGP